MKMRSAAGRAAWTVASLGLLGWADRCTAQPEGRASMAGEAAAEARARQGMPNRYNIQLGAGGLSLSAGVRGEYVDNVFLSDEHLRDDYILVPEMNVGVFLPVGQLNALALDVGVAYYHYLKHDELNTERPVINPDSELAFNFYSGDFAFKVSERFSYQESPFYETGETFYNVYDTGHFARFHNLAGAEMTWDLSDLIVTAGYHHENFWANDAVYDYIERASELFDAAAMYVVAPGNFAGVETAGSLNAYDQMPWNDNWRVRLGPAIRWRLSQYLTLRVGVGYERIQYEPKWESTLGMTAEDTYYAYAAIDHVVNRFIRHRLSVTHDNQSGLSSANLAGTRIRYGLTWNVHSRVTISPYFGIGFYEESDGVGLGAGPGESLLYLDPGVIVSYRYDDHWHANAGWHYRLQDSELDAHGYARNLVRLELLYQF